MRWLLLAAVVIAAAPPALAQTVDELRTQLEAQKTITKLLKERLHALEAESKGGARAVGPARESAEAGPAPERAPTDPEEERALERALVRRGTAVLPPYRFEVTPSFQWSRSASQFSPITNDSYVAAIDGRVGLPDGWMAGLTVPYVHRDVSGIGTNTGLGDVSVTGWKQIIAPSQDRPSLVASVRYTGPTGEDQSDTRLPLGSGFHRVTGQLSTAKTVTPMAFFGSVGYTHRFERSFGNVSLQPGDVFGMTAGASLSVTPDISVSTALNLAFERELERDGIRIPGSGSTFGTIEVDAGTVLTRGVFLSVFGAFGVTDDSPDYVFGMSLPVRF